MNSIDDPNETAKKTAETTEAEDTSKPGTERAAAEREMMSALQRAKAAAERVKDLAPEEEELEPPTERDEEEPPSGLQFTAPLPPPFAVASNGQLLLNVDACPELKLDGHQIFRAIVLSDEESAYAMRKLENVVHDMAGHLGGMLIKRSKSEPEGSGGNAEG